MANEPDVQRIKREKRGRRLEPAPAGMTRRRFLTFLGAGSAALAAGSVGAPTGGTGGGQGAGIGDVAEARAAQGSSAAGVLSFTPIQPTAEDDVVLPEGFEYDVVRQWGDQVTEDAPYGYNNDYVAYYPHRRPRWRPEQPGRHPVGQP